MGSEASPLRFRVSATTCHQRALRQERGASKRVAAKRLTQPASSGQGRDDFIHAWATPGSGWLQAAPAPRDGTLANATPERTSRLVHFQQPERISQRATSVAPQYGVLDMLIVHNIVEGYTAVRPHRPAITIRARNLPKLFAQPGTSTVLQVVPPYSPIVQTVVQYSRVREEP